jgi:hypothetical protein
MKNNLRMKFVLAVSVYLSATGISNAETNLDREVAMARSAAPAAISRDATIVVDGKVVVEGSNGWTCMPEGGAPMCNDEVWMRAMKAIGGKADFKADRIGISYMLLGDPPGLGVSNSDPFHPKPQQAADYVETGPHLMIIVPKHMLKGITDDPSGGGPYVMWGNTPYAHIMVPVTDSK